MFRGFPAVVVGPLFCLIAVRKRRSLGEARGRRPKAFYGIRLLTHFLRVCPFWLHLPLVASPKSSSRAFLHTTPDDIIAVSHRRTAADHAKRNSPRTSPAIRRPSSWTPPQQLSSYSVPVRRLSQSCSFPSNPLTSQDAPSTISAISHSPVAHQHSVFTNPMARWNITTAQGQDIDMR